MRAEPHQNTVTCSVRLGFASAEEAERIHRSVELDNEDYVVSRVEGSDILAEMSANSLRSLLHTLDDFMACVGVADKIVAKKH